MECKKYKSNGNINIYKNNIQKEIINEISYNQFTSYSNY